MAELQTKATDASVGKFLDGIDDEQMRRDCLALVDIMGKATKSKPRMWGSNIVGFGSYRYRYASGREGDWMLTAFSPRKHNLTLYVMPGFDGRDELMAKLGKHSGGLSCIYVKRLSDLHLPTLKKLVAASVKHLRKTYPARKTQAPKG
jgi:hypothetical protein